MLTPFLALFLSTAPAEAATLAVCSTCTYKTITAAVTAAAAGDTVTIAAGTYAESVTVAKNVTLRGAGIGSTVIAYTGSNLVNVTSGVVTFEDLSVQPSSGRCMQVGYGAAVTWNRVACSGASSNNNGGGITASNATLALVDSVFDGNSSTGCCYYGGHVYTSAGTLTVSGSTFTGGMAGRGGAIGTQGTLVAIDDSTFAGNQADQTGGALHLRGGSSTSTFSITDTSFEENVGMRSGGAIYLENFGGGTLARDTFCGNSADEDGGALHWKGGTTSTATIELSNTSFVENDSNRDGGAISFDNLRVDPALSNLLFLGNSANYRGSAISFNDTEVNVVNMVVAWNQGAEALTNNGGGGSGADTIAYSVFWENPFGDGYETAWTGTVSVEDPDLAGVSLDGDCSNDSLWLAPDSALIDAGDPTLLDPDGSISDIGAYGGPDADPDAWADADRDGWVAMFDCDDADAGSYPVDWYADDDGDAYGAGSGSGTLACDIPSGFAAVSGDCDDTDDSAFPGATEVCDGVDHDCDGSANEATSVDATKWYKDADKDGYGASSGAVTACDAPSGYVADATDCDDTQSLVRPGGTEACDGLDNDCDGVVDEIVPTWYRDADGDGYGTPLVSTTSCTRPTGYVGYAGDCNDSASAVRPDATEVCNAVDDDCDGSLDEGTKSTFYVDADKDGYGLASSSTSACSAPSGYVSTVGDCDDTASTVSPAAAEVCNGVDDDCDGATDDGVKVTWYRDADVDGYGTATGSIVACSGPSGFVTTGGDCDDASAIVKPGAVEVCNGVDDDCDLAVDDGVSSTYYTDDDGDGHGDAASSTQACSLLPGYAADATDCDDTAADVYAGATELCDSKDNDCDSLVDEVVPTWYRDNDGDGFGTASDTRKTCSPPGSFVASSADCDDGDSSISPAAVEVCDGVDQDCNGLVDDGAITSWYVDADKDGYGSTGTTPIVSCSGPFGYVGNDDDCDDSSSSVKPSAVETCNAVDDDCDGLVDDSASGASTWYVDSDGDGLGDPAFAFVSCSGPTGYVSSPEDCDDSEASIGAAETYYADYDGDGFGVSTETETACEPSVGFAEEEGDCDDADDSVHPDAAEALNGFDEDCDGVVDNDTPGYDDDGDGLTELGGDCDDDNPETNPSGIEECDGVDEDCSGVVDDGTICFDDDGDSYDELFGDCDDADPDVNPGAIEIMDNGIDDDCDGVVDDGLSDPDGDGVTEAAGDCAPNDASSYPGAPELADGEDNDCDGTTDEGTELYDDDGDGFAEVDDDCDDGDDGVFPGASEAADGVDQDCDGTVDEGTDAYDDDGDGVTEAAGDCDDASAAVSPRATEAANGADDDCDGEIDEGLSEDTDGDGPGDEEEKGCGCASPAGPSMGWPALAVLLIARRRRDS